MKNSVKILTAVGAGMGTIVSVVATKAFKKAKKFKAEKKEIDEQYQPVMADLYKEVLTINGKQQHEVEELQREFKRLRKQARTREGYAVQYDLEKIFWEDVLETFKQHSGEAGVNPGCLVVSTKYQQIQIEKLQRQLNKERSERKFNDALTNI